MNDQAPQQQPYYQPSFMYVQPQAQENQIYPVFQLPPQQYAQQQQPFYPQIPVQQPPYVFSEQQSQAEVPQNETDMSMVQHCTRRCKRFNAYKIGSAISIASFVAYFIVTPGAFPWFLIIAALSAGAMASKFIREHYAEEQPRFRKHAAWYGTINIAFLIVNLWSGGFPWAVVPIAVWGAVLAMHALSIYNTQPVKKPLIRHAIVYVAVGLIILVALSHLPNLDGNMRGYNRMNRRGENAPRSAKTEFRPFFMQRRFSGHHGRFAGNRPEHNTQPAQSDRPKRPENNTPAQSAKPAQPTQTAKPSQGTKVPERQHWRHGKHGGKHGGHKHTKRPYETSEPEEDEFRKEYAREYARHDNHTRFIMRTVGFMFMLIWTFVLLAHALKTKRAMKAMRMQQRAQAQHAELQSVDVQQPPVVLNTGSVQTN